MGKNTNLNHGQDTLIGRTENPCADFPTGATSTLIDYPQMAPRGEILLDLTRGTS